MAPHYGNIVSVEGKYGEKLKERRTCTMSTYNEREIISAYTRCPTTISNIAQQFSLCNVTISRILQRNHVTLWTRQQINQADLDVNYFQSIDDEYKAYYLGMLYMDGCVYRYKNAMATTLQLHHDEEDQIVRQFQETIHAPRQIVIDKRNGTSRSITIVNNVFTQHLLSLGCVFGKENRIWPDIPHMLMPHFVRGLFDADGSICKTTSHHGRSWRYVLVLLGNVNIITSLESILKDIGMNNISIKAEHGSLYGIRTARANNIQCFGEWIYNDANIFIKRKYDRWLDALSYFSR